MVSPVSIAMIKVHLRLDDDETGDDDYLEALLAAGTQGCLARIDRTLDSGDWALSEDEVEVLGQAIRLVVGHWYRNREGVNVGNISSELPQGVKWLLDPLRRVA